MFSPGFPERKRLVIESGSSRNLDMPKPAIGIFPKKGFRKKQHSGCSRSPAFSKNSNRDSPDSPAYMKTPIGIIPKRGLCKNSVRGSPETEEASVTICRFSACCSPCTASGGLKALFFRPGSTALCGRLPFPRIQNVFRTWRRFRSAFRRRHASRFP